MEQQKTKVSQFVTVGSRYYFCVECNSIHREIENYLLFQAHSQREVVRVEIEEIGVIA